MKPIKFLAMFQVDLFPDRSTVGREVVAELLSADNVFPPSTEAVVKPTATAPRARQPRLPLLAGWRRP